MNDRTFTKRWMPPGIIACLMLLLSFSHASAQTLEDCWVDWSGHEFNVDMSCDECGTYVASATPFEEGENPWDQLDDIIDKLTDRHFCPDCGHCSEDTNPDCYWEHHCSFCNACVDNGDFCLGCWAEEDHKRCYECLESALFTTHCQYCNNHFSFETSDACDCSWSTVSWHCTNCSELQCEICGGCMVVAGEETELVDGGCLEHAVCGECMEQCIWDGIHCTECHMCDEMICEECGMCESCADEEEHCPECGYCYGFGNTVDWCASGGHHCALCCEANLWLCDDCGDCCEGLGVEFCEDCGMCEECCKGNSEDSGCTHHYCIESSEYEDHICPNCEKCPDDTECEYCGMCEECQADYHCEHEICPESGDWDDHLCSDCGDCFEMDELCEICGKCEGCQEHCEHGYCPDDSSFEDDFDHFICQQCGDCYEGFDRCDYCELCTDCCEANTQSMGCDHDLCVESEDFAEHWCYNDGQCLELCNHDAGCTHDNISTEWESDDNAHWKVCMDCGKAVEKAIHSEGDPVTVTEPNPIIRMNGKANVYCPICEQFVCTVSIPYVPIPSDGSPYIVSEPKDYDGKTNTSAWEDVPNVYALMRVRAGGRDLTYQWYEQFGEGTPRALADKGTSIVGSNTPTLKTVVYTDACLEPGYRKYFCVITNSKGSVTSRKAAINAQHVFKRFENNGDGTHNLWCLGECSVAKWTKPHRYDEFELVRPATESQAGLRRQKCLDCDAVNTETIPKVEPGHVHAYDKVMTSPSSHWFVCVCGVTSPDGLQAHSYTSRVITPATETKTGEQKLTCTVCNYSKTEKIDKLPHTHTYWAVDPAHPDAQKWGKAKEYHYVFCKSGDGAMEKEAHDATTFTWYISKQATATSSGVLRRYCETCGYEEKKPYDYGTYPIFIEGGTTSHASAAPGTTVTVTYTKYEGLKWGNSTYWKDMAGSAQYSEYGLKSVTLSPNKNSSTATFTMPNGPVMLVVYNVENCYHTGSKYMGERVEPTCKGYGHEPDQLCSDCNAVVTPGARIEALGHDLPSEPIAGTAKIEYCTIWQTGYNPGYTGLPNTETHGYTGDFLCNRCGETVRGKRIPLKHGLVDKYNMYTPRPGIVWPGNILLNHTEATCTSKGYEGDTYCDYCDKLIERGERIPCSGHEWGEWETVREATTIIKGMEQRFCLRDESHKETRVIDYTGPDYRLKADKTKLNFEFNYGDTEIEPQAVTYRSIGRNTVYNLVEVSAVIEIYDSNNNRISRQVDANIGQLAIDGFTVTVVPNMNVILPLMEKGKVVCSVYVDCVNTEEGEFGDLEVPSFSISFMLNKADIGLKMETDSRVGRLKCPLAAPKVTSNVKDATLQWRSSDNSVATVDANTGRVMPLSAGTTTITATYEGNQYYKSAKVSYTLTVIGQQQFAGYIWQESYNKRNGGHSNSGPTDQILMIKPSTKTPGTVDITFSGFKITGTSDTAPTFTIKGVEVIDRPGGRVSYSPKVGTVSAGQMPNIVNYAATLEGGHLDATGTPVMKLILSTNRVEDTIWFGPNTATLDQIKDLETGVDEIRNETKPEGIFDLQGRKLDKITQPGIYIRDGRKVLIK